MLKNGDGENFIPEQKPAYDLKSLSEILPLSVATLRKYINSGDLKAKKIGRSYFVTGPNLMAFLDPDS